MEKAIHSSDYRAFLRLLREVREQLGVTQVELAERLSQEHRSITQSLVSKLERGEVRLDVIQLRWFCQALGITLEAFVQRLESNLGRKRKR
jgi:transcriptional regulator with XRE-family HTH domain